MAIDAHAFAADVMRRYRVRPEAIDAILAASDWEIHDPNSVSGGGTVYPAGPNRWRVVLYTAQEEACLHEAAHVWLYLNCTNELVAMLIDMMFIESDKRHMPRWKPFRELMATYRWGDGNGWPGMWLGEPYNRWNEHELWAGGASFSMGDVTQYPPTARRLYERMFEPRETVHLPLVMFS